MQNGACDVVVRHRFVRRISVCSLFESLSLRRNVRGRFVQRTSCATTIGSPSVV